MTYFVSLFVPTQLTTYNGERRGNRWERARATKAARLMGMVTARNHRVKSFSHARIEVKPVVAHRPGPLADVAAHVPTAKAVIDGLVDAGVLADDGPHYVLALTFLPPERGPIEGLAVMITGELV